MLDTAGFVLGHLAALILLWSSCFAAGSLVVRRIGFRDGLETIVVLSGVGFGLLGIALFLLGLAGALHGSVVAGLIVAVHAVALLSARRWLAPLLEMRRLHGWLFIAALAVAMPSFLLALYPPTAFDATLYHLPYARLFAEENAVILVEHLRFPVFPQLNEMLFTAALLLYDDVSAHLVQVLAFILTGLALASWASGLSRGRGWILAPAFWAGSPLAVYLAGSAYIDVGVAMFVTLAFLSLERWRTNGSGTWLLLSGAFAGMAAGSKYHGALIAVLMLGALVILARERRWRAILIFAAGVILCAGPFYLRNELATGNPFFPYLQSVFGGAQGVLRGEALLLEDATTRTEAVAAILRNTIASPEFIIFPWRTSFDRQAMHGLPPLAIWMLLVVPAAVAGAIRFPAARAAVIVAFSYAAVVAALDPRFLIIVFPLLVYGAAVWLSSVIRARWMINALVLLAVLPGPGYGAYRSLQQGAIPVSEEERHAYLGRNVPPYEALHYLNVRCGPAYSVYALRQESAAYHSSGRFLGDHFGTARFSRIEDDLGEPPALVTELRTMDVDYFLVGREMADALKGDEQFDAVFTSVWKSQSFEIFHVPGGLDCGMPATGGHR